MSEMNQDNLGSFKSVEEIKQTIKNALIKNEILGYFNNDLLYMQLFGKNNSLDKIFTTIGILVILYGTQKKEIEFVEGIIILTVGIGSFIISAILKKYLKFYLVYDTNREVFYSITSLKNKIFNKSKELSRKDIVELGVDCTFKDDNGSRAEYAAVSFKGDPKDNPGIRTSFVALLRNGSTINISDPVGLKDGRECAIARCHFFADCFGLNSVICEKDEFLKVIKDGVRKYKFSKSSLVPELEKVKKMSKNLIIFVLVFGGIITLIIVSLILFLVSLV